MNESKQRIAEYKKLLPDLKERVVAVALLLVISFTMVITTSFAWVVLSRSPEVTGVTTNIASNGNLEIALATGDGTIAPGESKVGDSSAAQSITAANITWGNMINLNDPSYGLENLVLRPAELNTAALLTSPLFGAEYDADGRIVKLDSSFGYATWVPGDGVKSGQFKASDQFGVRAISSMTSDSVGAAAVYEDLVEQATSANLAAGSAYTNLASAKSGYMQSLATMMGLYMTARMNSSDETLSNPECQITDIQKLRDMYGAFLGCFDQEAEAMAKIINVYLFFKHGETGYTDWTKEDIYEKDLAGIQSVAGISDTVISSLEQFKKDRNTIASDYEKLKTIAESGTSLKWKDSGLNGIVNNLVNVGACTIGKNNTPISSIGASNALSYMFGTQEARITNGILYRFEERTGAYIDVKNLGISATVKRNIIGTQTATVKANIQTTAPRDYNLFGNDIITLKNNKPKTLVSGDLVANDTYGLAVDLWVRTNAAGSYLTLQGNVLTVTKSVLAMGKDANGNEVQLYTLKVVRQTENGELTDEYEAYKIEDTWYNAITHGDLTQDLENEYTEYTFVEKMEEITTVVGYEGDNRVWDESAGLSVNSTTQGGGSCYVYYADTLDDQNRTLKLLEGLKVAFVDGEGKLLATAEMDTEHPYREPGKVIVPLVLSSDSTVIGEDTNGNPIYAITALAQNVPTRITAIVYLDGKTLTNEDVLSSADIQGKMNIQFGSSVLLDALDNEELSVKEVAISAEITGKKEFDYDTDSDLSTSVEIEITGSEAKKITAFFIREVNSTQGLREGEMTFERNEQSGKWEAQHTFTAPGKYVLRTVQLDGVEYDLSGENRENLVVTVTGFNIEFLTWDLSESNYAEVRTAEGSVSSHMVLAFASNDPEKMPKTVVGKFVRAEDQSVVNVPFTYNATQARWEGTVKFQRSGEYTMEYVVMDGDETGLATAMVKTAKLNLGMRIEVYTTSPHNFTYLPNDEDWSDNKQNLQMTIKILDDSGNEMKGWNDVTLYYNRKGSSADGLDAKMTWNPKGYYEGAFESSAGIFTFDRVEVKIGETVSVISRATEYPTFTILSPEPPKYESVTFSDYQYSPEGNAAVTATIQFSDTASVKGYFKNLDKPGEDLIGVEGAGAKEDGSSTVNWQFAIPKINDKQDGNWQLVEIELWNVYDADGNFYTEEQPMIVDLESEKIETKVVQTLTISFEQGLSQNFGKDTNGNVTGKFMKSYTISGLSVQIMDFENMPINGIKNVTLTFTYNNDSGAYGGYTSASLTNTAADFTISLADDGSGTYFAQSGSQTIQYAGSYTTTFSVMVGNTTVTYSGDKLPVNTPEFTVSSEVPSVKITARSNYRSSTNDDTSATVYYDASASSICGSSVTNYSQPHVTITLSNAGDASGATLQFAKDGGGTVHLYTSDGGSKATDSYTWTGNGTCQRWVGYYKSRSGATDDRTVAGTLTASVLKLTYNDVEYTVDIPDITINNPD